MRLNYVRGRLDEIERQMYALKKRSGNRFRDRIADKVLIELGKVRNELNEEQKDTA